MYYMYIGVGNSMKYCGVLLFFTFGENLPKGIK